jgi:hypothetical protein
MSRSTLERPPSDDDDPLLLRPCKGVSNKGRLEEVTEEAR